VLLHFVFAITNELWHGFPPSSQANPNCLHIYVATYPQHHTRVKRDLYPGVLRVFIQPGAVSMIFFLGAFFITAFDSSHPLRAYWQVHLLNPRDHSLLLLLQVYLVLR
jgi:hypothetical protein